VLAPVFLDDATTVRSTVIASSKIDGERRRRDHSSIKHAVAVAIKHYLLFAIHGFIIKKIAAKKSLSHA